MRFIQISLGLVFLYAGLTKLWDPKAFARIISQYDLLPEPFLPVAAIGLPVLELLAGLLPGLCDAGRGFFTLWFPVAGFSTIRTNALLGKDKTNTLRRSFPCQGVKWVVSVY